MEIFNLLETIEDMLENSKTLPFTNKAVLDKEEFALDAIEKISNLQLLKDDGIIIIETDEPERDINELYDENLKYKMYDLRKYGRASLIFLK